MSVEQHSSFGKRPIKHIVIVVQENRSFDDFFARFPGADGAIAGCMKPPDDTTGQHSKRCPKGDIYVRLKPTSLVEPCDFGHGRDPYLEDYDGGSMDGFGLVGNGPAKCGPGKAGVEAYQYVKRDEIQPYWSMAQQYVLGDHMFQTQGSGSFTAHQDLIAGTTTYDPQQIKSLVDYPSNFPWGCDAPAGTKTTILVDQGSVLKKRYNRGPFPCMSYRTLADLLDDKNVSWKYYSPPEPGGNGKVWNAFDAIRAVRKGPAWGLHIAYNKAIFKAIGSNRLPDVSWIVPDVINSDHPGGHKDTGPCWVASIVNAIGESSYWDSAAIIVVWDDWGGFYDHVPPPFFDEWGGLGFRVPLLIVSPYAREADPGVPGYISHTQYEFGSILKFVETNFQLGSLGVTDARAKNLRDAFDLTQKPRSFKPIACKYSREYYLRQPYSYLPVDTE